jgi:hypothetical protein
MTTSYRRVGPPREASGSIGKDLSKDLSEDLASASEGGDLDASALRIWNLEMPDAPVVVGTQFPAPPRAANPTARRASFRAVGFAALGGAGNCGTLGNRR